MHAAARPPDVAGAREREREIINYIYIYICTNRSNTTTTTNNDNDNSNNNNNSHTNDNAWAPSCPPSGCGRSSGVNRGQRERKGSFRGCPKQGDGAVFS